ncbi:MAG: metallophosphoesterase [Actinomycetota bacterium]|nr:metallophosphoesterase [Actinomycetota bacterium]
MVVASSPRLGEPGSALSATLSAMARRRRALARLRPFAVEDTSVQLTWGDSRPGEITATAGDARATVTSPGGPGALSLDGLPADTSVRIDVAHSDGESHRLVVRTLAPPPGAPLSRLVTVSDLHVGSLSFGLARTMRDPSGVDEPFAVRTARAALAEALRWGSPDLLVAKGDLTNKGKAAEWDVLNGLLRDVDVPLLACAGNHDAYPSRDVLPPEGYDVPGTTLADPIAVRDLDGLRVIVADSVLVGEGEGTLDHVGTDILDAAAESDRPVMVCLHHPPDSRYAFHYPPGVPRGQSHGFLDRLARLRPDALVTAGHTHRNRRRDHGPLVVTEVSSTKDYPGAWAGYRVHEGGIRQVVRRTAAPEALAWSEYCRLAVGGVWGLYSPGALAHRSFTHPWPTR